MIPYVPTWEAHNTSAHNLVGKFTEALEKLPAAKPLRCRWSPEDDSKPRVNTSYKKVPRQFVPRRRGNPPRRQSHLW